MSELHNGMILYSKSATDSSITISFMVHKVKGQYVSGWFFENGMMCDHVTLNASSFDSWVLDEKDL